ncbi:right-handed parallel beta-helix repeat-containing protein [Paenibacillus campi]|uniref:right-handed parallel beta-helix repeat-containing protein n=1 Tax=Paenibacillus campi TaxID=3106031 RepID=UPI002AFE0B44|nr:right-handed parallel beta-helix repeat-containing protein [Paenibacillus sp. SGZ-1014]
MLKQIAICTIIIGLLTSVSVAGTSHWQSLALPQQIEAATIAPVYYVASGGNDEANGTLTAPWQTLQHAADQAQPGSTIYVRGGVYRQKLHLTRSGNAQAGMITFARYKQETPILDGTGLTVDGLEGMVSIDQASYITIDGLDIRNYGTDQSGHVPAGISVIGAGGYIRLLNNHIHHIANTAAPQGNELGGRDAHGIAIYGTKAPSALHHLTIRGNELDHLVLGSSESMALNGNVTDFEIAGNRIHDNDNIGIDTIGFEHTAPDPAYDQVRNGRIYGNIVYNITSNRNPSYGRKLPNQSNGAAGMYVDGGRNIVIERNRSYNNDIGLEIASEHKGKATSGITARSNVIYSNRYTGIGIGGYDDQRGLAIDCAIINNTLHGNDTLSDEPGNGAGQLLIQYGTSRNVIENNIVSASATGVLIYNEYASSGNRLQSNLYYTPGGAAQAWWIWNGKVYESLAAFQAASKQEQHGMLANPLFVNVGAADYRVRAHSPALDSGFNDTKRIGALDMAGQRRLSGKAVNRGAYE